MTKNIARFLILAVALSALVGCQSARRVLRVGEAADPNPGPCPSAYALADAARLVEIRGEERLANVGFTGEIMGVRSFCRYYGEQPIIADLEIDFGFGRGAAAEASSHTYQYFVAVTRRDQAVIHKETFPIRANFGNDDRVYQTERIDYIKIPRATETTSGTNFEIIVGFELTPEELEFNRAGKRFREGVIATPER